MVKHWLNINLPVGEYTGTVSWNNITETRTIKITETTPTNRLKVGRYNKNGEGELQDTEATIIPISKSKEEVFGCQLLEYKEESDKAEVIFKINNIEYTSTLDKEGKAYKNINLEIGEYSDCSISTNNYTETRTLKIEE